jgi:hypothetical protein
MLYDVPRDVFKARADQVPHGRPDRSADLARRDVLGRHEDVETARGLTT